MMMLLSMSSTSVPDFLCYFLGWLISLVIFWCIIEPCKAAVKNPWTHVTVFFSDLFATCKKLLDQVQHLEFIIATQQMNSDCASSSESSSSMVSSEKYDVFLSFRGEDTRKSFISHLYVALCRKNLKTFKDDNELEKGDEISPALIKAIEESCVSIIIFSKAYASSRWCLNELIKILQCKKDHERIVIPVFYNIDPSHVRKQSGSYQQAFAKHGRDLKHNKDKLQKWKASLTEAANLNGWDSQNYRDDSVLIEDIVEDVLQKLNLTHPYEDGFEGLVGIEEKYAEIESLLKIGSNAVRILGIWGMVGRGKTTLAKVSYAKLYSQFEGHCFIDVRKEAHEHGVNALRDKIFSTLLKEKNRHLDASYIKTSFSKRRLARRKVVVVLDGVTTSDQIEDLIINNTCLGSGSRVIVTARDWRIFNQFGLDECEPYEVKELNCYYSLQLFCLNAFRETHPKNGYEELSKSAISYCKGNPLALQTLGRHLRSRNKEGWESAIEKLQKFPNVKIHDVLRLSFDDLERTQKDILLDIACFLRGWPKGRATNLLEALYFSSASAEEATYRKESVEEAPVQQVLTQLEQLGLCSPVEIRDIAPVTTSNTDNIDMHDSIQETGREIVNQESEDPGKRSRLWRTEDVCDVLKKNKGTEVVEGIKLDMSELVEDLYLGLDSFKKLTYLRYLEFHYRHGVPIKKVHFPDGLGWLSEELRYVNWHAFPLKSLPQDFCAEMLVELHMRESHLIQLWDRVQDLVHLKEIDLSGSKYLIEIPDLSKAPNLERLYLRDCESLRQLHPSIFSRPKLMYLDLSHCKMVESLKTNVHSKSLRKLKLSFCSSLTEFSVTSAEMTELCLSGTAIHELPSSFWRNSKLIDLHLGGCDKLNTVGNKLSNDPGLGSLTTLHLSGCTQINASNLWCILDGIRSLKSLDLDECCNLEAIPINIRNHSMLEKLSICDCEKLVSLPAELPSSLQKLQVVNCTSLDTQGPVLENMLQSVSYSPQCSLDDGEILHAFFFLPGARVPGKFGFQTTTEASIAIPPILKSNVCGFIFCIILSEGLNFGNVSLGCCIYEHGKKFDSRFIDQQYYGPLISDHVLLCWYGYNIPESGGDYYNLSFEFRLFVDEDEQRSMEGIKGCGVFPLHASRPDCCSIEEIVESKPNAQISDESQHLEMDTDESQHLEMDTDESQHLEMDTDEFQPSDLLLAVICCLLVTTGQIFLMFFVFVLSCLLCLFLSVIFVILFLFLVRL